METECAAATCHNILINKCSKCKKVVRNGILCDNCDKCYHFNKCSNVCEDKIPNNKQLCVPCLSFEALIHENITTEHVNSEVVRKLLNEISTLHAIIPALQSERIQDTHIQKHQANENGWNHASKGNLKKEETGNTIVFSSSEK
jgi:hypothetical protein